MSTDINSINISHRENMHIHLMYRHHNEIMKRSLFSTCSHVTQITIIPCFYGVGGEMLMMEENLMNLFTMTLTFSYIL